MTDSLNAEANPFRFSTKYYDAETGLSDFGRRYYHAVLGRWLNRDPIGELGGANVYAYVGNNPLNRVDYLGLNACSANDPWCQGTDRGPDNNGGGPPNDAKPPCAKDPGCGDQEEPDSRPASQPTTQPQSQPSLTPCEVSLAAAKGESRNKALLDWLNSNGCAPPITCDSSDCTGSNVVGGYNERAPGKGGSISMCGSFSEDMLRHELIHAWQQCPASHGGNAPPRRDRDRTACMEYQAYLCAGHPPHPKLTDPEVFATYTCAASLHNYCKQVPADCHGIDTNVEFEQLPQNQRKELILDCLDASDDYECNSCDSIPKPS